MVGKETMLINTPIYQIDKGNNNIFIKREDMIPYSFGGNKARKAILFFEEIDKLQSDFIVTYGSAYSNHCRIVANMASERGIPCQIIAPLSQHGEDSYNSRMMKLFGAGIETCPVEEVHTKIESALADLEKDGYKPYFIAGGGHGDIGTKAYIECYKEICDFESKSGQHFDYIFHASGTGTTQAGLICGQLLNGDDRKIVGISIAREESYGRGVILESIKEYFRNHFIDHITAEQIDHATIFDASCIGKGYASREKELDDTIAYMISKKGIPLDQTYTGKAYLGMQKYLQGHNLQNKNILFIHTGGTPLFFDYLNELC